MALSAPEIVSSVVVLSAPNIMSSSVALSAPDIVYLPLWSITPSEVVSLFVETTLVAAARSSVSIPPLVYILCFTYDICFWFHIVGF